MKQEPWISIDKMVVGCDGRPAEKDDALRVWLRHQESCKACGSKRNGGGELVYGFKDAGIHVTVAPRFRVRGYEITFNANTVDLDVLRTLASKTLNPKVTSLEVAIDYPSLIATDWLLFTPYFLENNGYSYQDDDEATPHSLCRGAKRSPRQWKKYDKIRWMIDTYSWDYTIRDCTGEIHTLADYDDLMRLELAVSGEKRILGVEQFKGIVLVNRHTDIHSPGNNLTRIGIRRILEDSTYYARLPKRLRHTYLKHMSNPKIVHNMQPSPYMMYRQHLPMLRKRLVLLMEPFGGYVNPHWLPLDERRVS